jgi:DNA-binding HxlR family transcriptional regulator
MLTDDNPKQERIESSQAKQCPFGMDLAALGKRWTFHILRSIGISHIDRFNQILRSIPGLTPRVLIMRLNELEECGLLEPITIQERPMLVRWALTEKGRDTLPILQGYSSYIAKWHPNASLMNHRIRPRPQNISELVETYRQQRTAGAQESSLVLEKRLSS